MPRRKKKIRPFTMIPKETRAQLNLNILNAVKNGKDISVKGLSEITGLSSDILSERISVFAREQLIRLSGGFLFLEKNPVLCLGVGIGKDKCFISLINAAGDVVDSEEISIEPIQKFKGKKKEIVALLDEIRRNTKFRERSIDICGIGIPEKIMEKGGNNFLSLPEGIGRIFNSDTYFCRSVTASGYGEREVLNGRGDILYVHSDVGVGIVLQGEIIYQSDSKMRGKESSYLRSWEQFGIVNIAKNLVEKGVGSSLVYMADGDTENIDLEMVLRASEEKDELAKDVVLRSALALGVRVAYLVNVFDARTVILGGGIEQDTCGFKEAVRESTDKFLKKELEGKIQIISGKLGEQAASFGAANLCVRELFSEVLYEEG